MRQFNIEVRDGEKIWTCRDVNVCSSAMKPNIFVRHLKLRLKLSLAFDTALLCIIASCANFSDGSKRKIQIKYLIFKILSIMKTFVEGCLSSKNHKKLIFEDFPLG